MLAGVDTKRENKEKRSRSEKYHQAAGVLEMRDSVAIIVTESLFPRGILMPRS
jgi:hypothetical protein